jgi:hypothetical protein
VVDDAGRGVAGAGVKLGLYTTESDATGAYAFRYVPAGQYELTIERHLLPADVAWDGRGERFTLTARSRVKADLHVAPLNAIHGRVYSDLNQNARFDAGEGIRGAVVQLGDRFTATDETGAYTFFNLWPATYVLRLAVERLPGDLVVSGVSELTTTLGDDGPVTGADFRVVRKVKPVIWSEPSR